VHGAARARRRAGAPPRDFRCTALAVALDAEAGTLAAVQVGDGVVALRAADGSVRLLGESDGGEYSGEVSCFVPTPAPTRGPPPR
jgi:hypothetical protein